MGVPLLCGVVVLGACALIGVGCGDMLRSKGMMMASAPMIMRVIFRVFMNGLVFDAFPSF